MMMMMVMMMIRAIRALQVPRAVIGGPAEPSAAAADRGKYDR